MRSAFLSLLPRVAIVGALAILPAVASAQAVVDTKVETSPVVVAAPTAPVATPDVRLDVRPATTVNTGSVTVVPMAAVQASALQMRHDATNAPAPMMQDGRTRTNTALMLVGLGTLLVGAAVGDDAGTVLIIGGAAIGFYGLYRFLNGQ